MDAGADTSAMQQENTQLKERIAELEEQRTEHEALFTRVLDHLEVADDAEGDADGAETDEPECPSDGAGRAPRQRKRNRRHKNPHRPNNRSRRSAGSPGGHRRARRRAMCVLRRTLTQ